MSSSDIEQIGFQSLLERIVPQIAFVWEVEIILQLKVLASEPIKLA
jgi:hypothetical protein